MIGHPVYGIVESGKDGGRRFRVDLCLFFFFQLIERQGGITKNYLSGVVDIRMKSSLRPLCIRYDEICFS